MSNLSIPPSVHQARDKVEHELKRYKKMGHELNSFGKAFHAYQRDLQRLAKSSDHLSSVLNKLSTTSAAVQTEATNLPDLPHLEPNPKTSHPISESMVGLSEYFKEVSLGVNEYSTSVTGALQHFQERSKKYEEKIPYFDNEVEDLNFRYDWALDRLRSYGEKEKKKGDPGRMQKMSQALTDKAGGIEERRFEMVAEMSYLSQARYLLVVKAAIKSLTSLATFSQNCHTNVTNQKPDVETIKGLSLSKLNGLRWRKDDIDFLRLEHIKGDYDLKGAGWSQVKASEKPAPRPPPTPISTQEMMNSLESESNSKPAKPATVVTPIKAPKKRNTLLKLPHKKKKMETFAIGEPENFQKKNRNELANMGLPTNMLPDQTNASGSPPPPPPGIGTNEPGDRSSAPPAPAPPAPAPALAASPLSSSGAGNRASAPAPPAPGGARAAAPAPPAPGGARAAAPAPPAPGGGAAPPGPVEPAYEEPAYEEPAYEEPAYEEPAYEEPAYEEPAGGVGDREPLTSVKLVKTIYDSVADAEGELSFDEDQFIVVFDFSDPDWWHGIIGELVGYFPASYVEEVEPSEVPPEMLDQAYMIQEQQQ